MFLFSMRTCTRLIWRDMAVFWPSFTNRFINACIWVIVTLAVFQYIGFADASVTLGAFMACANVVSWGFFEVMENVSRLIADEQGDRSITYALTLPLPQWMVFFRIAVSNALQAIVIGFFILPLAKIALWNSFSFEHASFVKTFLIFILAHLFYGFFSLWLASMVKSLDAISDVWMRVVFPLWFLGGYQFTWKLLFQKNNVLAYCNLVNPLMYCTEGIRAALLGQEGYINFWVCCGMLVIFTVIVGLIGTHRMMRKFDCL